MAYNKQKWYGGKGKSAWSRRSYVHQKTGVSLTHIALVVLGYLYLTKKSRASSGASSGAVTGAPPTGVSAITTILEDMGTDSTSAIRDSTGTVIDTVAQSLTDIKTGAKIGWDIGTSPWSGWNILNKPFQKVDDWILKQGKAFVEPKDLSFIADMEPRKKTSLLDVIKYGTRNTFKYSVGSLGAPVVASAEQNTVKSVVSKTKGSRRRGSTPLVSGGRKALEDYSRNVEAMKQRISEMW